MSTSDKIMRSSFASVFFCSNESSHIYIYIYNETAFIRTKNRSMQSYYNSNIIFQHFLPFNHFSLQSSQSSLSFNAIGDVRNEYMISLFTTVFADASIYLSNLKLDEINK